MMTIPLTLLAARRSHWQAALPVVSVAPEPKPKRRESTIIHLNVAARTAQVTVNGQSRTYALKAVDPYEYRRQLVNTHGYKSTMLGDVILLTRKAKAA